VSYAPHRPCNFEPGNFARRRGSHGNPDRPTVQLSLRRFQAERWWERKVEAYTRIIEALHHVIAYSKLLEKELSENQEYSEEHRDNMASSSHKAMNDLRMAADVGAYIISDDVAKILAELEARPIV
jgi:hypothetical protein